MKTTLRTKWGTYAYNKMPFRLINARETFQRDTDIAFTCHINKFVLVYLDDIIAYSKKREDHVTHLNAIIERCPQYGI